MSERNDQRIRETLESLLRFELLAAQSYRCLQERMPQRKELFHSLRQSHERRSQILRGRIIALGGTPRASLGQALIDGNDPSALARLHEAELAHDRRLRSLPSTLEAFASVDLLPEHRRTLRELSAAVH